MAKKRRKKDRAKPSVAKAIAGPPIEPNTGFVTANSNTARFSLTSTDFILWAEEAYKTNEMVRGGIDLIINAFLEAPLRFKDVNTGLWLESHPTIDLFQHINPNSSYRTFMFTLLLNMYLGDVGYIEKVFSRRGVTELKLLRPDLVTVLSSENKFIEGYEYRPNTEAIFLPPKNVVPLQFIDPTNVYKGHSPLKSLAKRVDEDTEATKHSVAILQNGGAPGSILFIDGNLSIESQKELRDSFANGFKGSRNGSMAVLDKEFKYERTGSSNKDMGFRDMQEVSEAKFLSTMRIPLPIYGSITGSAGSTFNNMREAGRQLWRQAIRPLQRMVEDAINNDPDLTDNFTIRAEFDTSVVPALQEDAKELSDRCIKMYQGELITRNEARIKQGFEPIEGGDEFFMATERNNPILPPNEVPVPPSEAVKHEIIVKQEPAAVETSEEDKVVEETKQETPTAQFLDNLSIALGRENLSNKFLLPMLKLADKHLQRHINDSIALIGQKSQQSSKVVKQFERNRLDSGLVALLDLWVTDLQEDSEEVIGALQLQSAEASALSVGVGIDLEAEAVRSAVKDSSFKFANSMANTSAASISDVFRNAFEEGKGLRDITKELQELGTGWSKTRASMIARSETSRAANEGAALGYEQSGVVGGMEWTAVLDSKTSEICQHLDGNIIPIKGEFIGQQQGFTQSNGKPYNLTYTDGVVRTPPAHPNCRCTLIPILSDEDTTEQ